MTTWPVRERRGLGRLAWALCAAAEAMAAACVVLLLAGRVGPGDAVSTYRSPTWAWW